MGNLCNALLGIKTVSPDINGAMHHAWVQSSWLHCNLVHTQEYIIKNLLPTDGPIIVGHFTDIKSLVESGRKAIYITITPDDWVALADRANAKVVYDLQNRNVYNELAGESWPSYEEYINGKIVPEIYAGTPVNGFKYFNYSTPSYNSELMLAVSFDQIRVGYSLIDQLAKFLNVSAFDRELIVALIDEYRSFGINSTVAA